MENKIATEELKEIEEKLRIYQMLQAFNKLDEKQQKNFTKILQIVTDNKISCTDFFNAYDNIKERTQGFWSEDKELTLVEEYEYINHDMYGVPIYEYINEKYALMSVDEDSICFMTEEDVNEYIEYQEYYEEREED